MNEAIQARRNLNPHKPAVIAMSMWGEEYSRQGVGSMEFWDKLSQLRKQICREVVARLDKAPEEIR
jgi:hypothetical protein